MLKIIFCYFTLFFLLTANAYALNAWDILPAYGEISGWTAQTTSLCNKKRATMPDSLYNVIDGGAYSFIQRGFVNGQFDGYQADTINYMCISVYNQGTQENAVSVYTYRSSTIRDSQIISIPGAYKVRRNLASLSRYSYDMIVGPFFLVISAVQSPVCSTAAISFMTKIAQTVNTSIIITPLNSKPDIRSGTIKIFDICGRQIKDQTTHNPLRSSKNNLMPYGVYVMITHSSTGESIKKIVR